MPFEFPKPLIEPHTSLQQDGLTHLVNVTQHLDYTLGTDQLGSGYFFSASITLATFRPSFTS